MNIKVFLLIFALALGLMIFSDNFFNIFESGRMLAKKTIGPKGIPFLQVFQFAMFLVLGFSIIPIMIRLFVILQLKIGNGELPLVQFLHAHEQGAVFSIWGFYAIGLCYIVPEFIKNGL